jgi:cytochrome c biogenesis protein CcmG, thiol:disulfide interchange protein DsbE
VRSVAGSLALVLVAAAAGCTADARDPATPSPFTGCAALTAAPATTATDLPDLSLPCFTGGDPVSLRGLRGPAVINIWASWCDPCRRELPVMQSLADRAGDRLTVLGVDTGDGREAGASFAADKGVTMPTLFDQDRKLIDALARTALPITIFLDGSGRSYVNLLPLDAAKLAGLVREHTGVTVTP